MEFELFCEALNWETDIELGNNDIESASRVGASLALILGARERRGSQRRKGI